MFLIILFSVLRHSINKEGKNYKQKAMATFLLAIMFGVGWIFGVLGSTGLPDVISLPCQITFVIVVGFQGLLVFLLHPCRSKDAREEWKKWFYYATCRSKAHKIQLRSKQNQDKNGKKGSKKGKSDARRTSHTSYRSSHTSSFADSQIDLDQLQIVGGTLTERKHYHHLDTISEEVEESSRKKAKMRQMYIFESSSDQPLTFGETEKCGGDLICFSPTSDSSVFANENVEDTKETDNRLTWQTFDYDEELQTGATTVFYNFEDDFHN